MVLRKFGVSGDLFDIIGINDIPAGGIEQVVTYQVPDNERINVQAGDVIGFAWNSPGVKYVQQGLADDDDVETMKVFTAHSPDNLNVNYRLDGAFNTYERAYSIKAIMSGIMWYRSQTLLGGSEAKNLLSDLKISAPPSCRENYGSTPKNRIQTHLLLGNVWHFFKSLLHQTPLNVFANRPLPFLYSSLYLFPFSSS